MVSFFSTATLIFAAFVASAATPNQTKPDGAPALTNRIVRYSPTSDRPDRRIDTISQVRVEFGENMVPAGFTDGSKVFDVMCAPQMHGRMRWNDTKTWILDFDTDLDGNKLPSATSCNIQLKPTVKTLSGKPIVGNKQISFVVDGPNIISLYPGYGDVDGFDDEEGDGDSQTKRSDWTQVNEDQVFIITTDTPVDPASVVQNAYFLIDGPTKSRIGVDILTGKKLDEVKKARSISDADMPKTIVLQARGRFPFQAKVRLVWGAGIKALASNVARVVTSQRLFQVRPALRAEVKCYRVNQNAGCVPLSDIRVQFSAGVPTSEAQKVYLLLPDGKTIFPALDSENGKKSYTSEVRFPGPFAENASYKIILPKGLKDEAGRLLENAKPVEMTTASLPPLLKFPARFGVVEANLGSETGIPVTLRNIEPLALGKMNVPSSFQGSALRIGAGNISQIIRWLNAVTGAADYATKKYEDDGRIKSIFGKSDATQTFSVPSIAPEPGKPSADTVALIPLKQPGFYVVEMQSKILGQALVAKSKKTPSADRTMYVPTSALVTNLVAHVKKGNENSLVWVTRLDSGEPAPGAMVTFYDCNGNPLTAPVATDSDGIAKFAGRLNQRINAVQCSGSGAYSNGFFVAASLGSDFTFTHSSWSDGIEPYRFGDIYYGDFNVDYGKLAAHTIIDQVLVRAGETVSMKHFVRAKTTAGLTKAGAGELPTQVVIQHDGDDTSYSFPLTWNEQNQTALTSWSIPSNAKLGSYTVSLVTPNGKWNSSFTTGRIQVQEFKIPLMKANIIFPSKPLVQPGNVDVQINVSYQNGGGAKGLDASLEYTVENAAIYFPGYGEYYIANGGVEAKQMKSGQEDDARAREAIKQSVTLDATGSAVLNISGLKGLARPQHVNATLEYRDIVGETQRVSKTLTVYSADQIVGVKVGERLSNSKNVPFTAVSLDVNGNPVSGSAISFKLMEEITTTNRTRGVGGTYIYDTTTVIRPAQFANFKCDGLTNKQGLMNCTLSTKPGNYYIVASLGSGQKISLANAWVHVSGLKDNMNAGTVDDRFDLIPEKMAYEPGETARFEAKIPMQSANILLTTEREGIIQSKVIRGWTPARFLDLKIADSFAPNVFVSALAVRGRVASQNADTRVDGMVDLAKPTFKLGLTRLEISRKTHELKVEVTPGVLTETAFVKQSKFSPGDVVVPVIRVTGPDGKAVTGEVAVAIVDEGLLDLLPNKSFDLMRRLFAARSLDVMTYTAQMHVVGKRHYGLKAVPLGGDGAIPGEASRKLFKPLIKWAGSVKVDESGIANLNCTDAEVNNDSSCVRFKLNDSLTKFRIIVAASSGISYFGQGESSVVSTKDFIVEPSTPAIARTNDSQNLEIQVRNTTLAPKTVSVCAVATFAMSSGSSSASGLPCQTVQLAPQSAATVNLGHVNVPAGALSASYSIRAQDQNKSLLDSKEYTQRILPDVLTRTLSAEMKQVNKPFIVPVEAPATAVPGLGGVSVKLMDKLTSGLTTVKDRFDTYLWDSIEYRISKALALQNAKAWAGAMSLLPSLVDSEGLVKFYPESKMGSPILTAYILKASALLKSKDFSIPLQAREKMLNGLISFAEGKSRMNRSVSTAVSSYVQRVHAFAALAAYNVFNKSELEALPRVSNDQLPNVTLIDLIELYDSQGMTAQRDEMEGVIRNRLIQRGTTWALMDDFDKRDWSLFNSTDSDTADLIRAVTATSSNAWRSHWTNVSSGLVLTALSKLNESKRSKGSWDTTIANALMAHSFREFSRVYESTPVSGITDVSLAAEKSSVDWSKTPEGQLVSFGWPAGMSQVSVAHRGDANTAAPWALVSAAAAVPVTEASGALRIEKRIEPIHQERSDRYTVGDTFKVTLKIKPSAVTYQVALMDPIPAGAQILRSNAGFENGTTNWSADYEELGQDSYRAFYSGMGTSEINVEYKIRLNNAGTFKLPATQVEALYTPEVYGLYPNATWVVEN